MQGVPAEIGAQAACGVTAAPADERRRVRSIGVACIVASALAFGAMAILARAAYASGVDTYTLLALRFTLAAALLGAIAHIRGVAMPRGRDLATLVLMGGLGYAGQAFTFFTALTLAPAGVVALLLYLYPALVALLAALFLHERLTAVRLLALTLALAGMALTVAPAVSGEGSATPAGIAYAISAAVIYAVYIVVGTRVSARVSSWATAAIVCAAAAVVCTVAAALHGPHWPASGAGWLAIIAIALVSTVAAITLFFAGLARIGATRASTLSTVEPMFTVVLAAIVLHEGIAPIQMAGGALILGAVWLLARGARA